MSDLRAASVDVQLRRATLDDVPALMTLIAVSARALCGSDYTPAQVEAAIGTAWGRIGSMNALWVSNTLAGKVT